MRLLFYRLNVIAGELDALNKIINDEFPNYTSKTFKILKIQNLEIIPKWNVPILQKHNMTEPLMNRINELISHYPEDKRKSQFVTCFMKFKMPMKTWSP
jgi:hypothetical protein